MSATTNNVIRLRLPETAKQADRLAKMARREKLVDVQITLVSDSDRFREQRSWRFLFGLYQDCASVRWSKGFKKSPDVPFIGKMRTSRLMLFVREALPLVAQNRVEIHINGERLRRRLLEVMAA
jgi:hypothetical protein